MSAPTPAEVRRRTTCRACRHRRWEHAEPIVDDGHCEVTDCGCVGWDPMTAEEWRAVYADSGGWSVVERLK